MPVQTAELRSRAAIWQLLASLYRHEISAGLAKRLIETEVLSSLDSELDVDLVLLGEPEGIKQLALEYTRIFIGPGKHVAPYGSVHHPGDPKKGRLWGDTTIQIKRFAEDLGLKFEGEGYDNIPDHVGHELELFSILLARYADAVDAGDDALCERLLSSQRYLLNVHINQWVPPFCAKVETAATYRFYIGVAKLTTWLIDVEAAQLPPRDASAGTE